ncbi:hypothetical protein DPMN_055111 [Dreissena polymorpha]|uniref:Uncharacterized protein n=1 Tax=Dreissena polymorpha TaxID=45954 RepID=A0A9D4HTR4_DREPO|nr:hypothetical protein DPMN_055111 [Dreissena polymorpha]
MIEQRSRNHGRRPRGSHLDKGNYTPSKCDGPLYSDETFSCYTVECQDESVEATGGLLSELTLQTKEADDDMSYDAGASDVGIGFDLRKWYESFTRSFTKEQNVFLYIMVFF